MADSTGDRTVRLQVEVSGSELKAIDDYRFQSHLPNRSAAVPALLQSGMTSETDVEYPKLRRPSGTI
jgi:hypothetical protein